MPATTATINGAATPPICTPATTGPTPPTPFRETASDHFRATKRNGNAKITAQQARSIKDMIARGHGNGLISRALRVSYHVVSAIRAGKAWAST